MGFVVVHPSRQQIQTQKTTTTINAQYHWLAGVKSN
jgi:hypothetical protein